MLTISPRTMLRCNTPVLTKRTTLGTASLLLTCLYNSDNQPSSINSAISNSFNKQSKIILATQPLYVHPQKKTCRARVQVFRITIQISGATRSEWVSTRISLNSQTCLLITRSEGKNLQFGATLIIHKSMNSTRLLWHSSGKTRCRRSVKIMCVWATISFWNHWDCQSISAKTTLYRHPGSQWSPQITFNRSVSLCVEKFWHLP